MLQKLNFMKRIGRFGSAAVLAAIAWPTTPLMAGAQVEVKAAIDRSVLPVGRTQSAFVRVAVTPAKRTDTHRALMNIALVIDRSGSMSSQALMENARRAAQMAVDRMGRDDIMAVISYDDRVAVDVPATKVLDKSEIKGRIASLTPRGSTAIHAALLAAANEVRKFQSRDRVNRIVLISDGMANVGPSRPADFVSLGRELASEGITVSTIGLGNGYNEDLMAGLARSADGGHVFVQESADLADFLSREFDDAASTVGQDAEIIIHVKEGARPLKALGRDAKIDADRIVYRVGTLIGGVEQVLLAEIEVSAATSSAERQLIEVEVAYDDGLSGKRVTTRATATVSFDADPAKVEQSENATVLKDIATLQSRAAREEAVKLRDQGQIEAARLKFESNAAQLRQFLGKSKDAASYKPLLGELKASEAAAAADAQSQEGWSKARKSQRATDGNSFGASTRY